jgi:hypothetical protein
MTEQECYAFLAFDMSEDVEAVRLTITAPEDVRDAADMLLNSS